MGRIDPSAGRTRWLLLGLLAAACSGGPPPAADTAASAVALPGKEYVIGPGDALNIFVYRAPELSVSDLPVRPDGRISVPLVPDIRAAGRTPTELGKVLTERLKEYVNDPVVTIMVRSFVGPFDQQIRVIGEAVEPIAIPYRDQMTVLDVMIQTKGLTKYAAGNRAVLVRRAPGGGETPIHVRLDDLLKSGDMSQNISMRPGDTLIIPQTWF